MKAVLFTRPEEFIIADLPVPEPGPGEVQIKVICAGICGTDLHIYKGEYEAIYPIIPGHEFSGLITKVGPNVKYFTVGDRVTADPNIPCYRCLACKRGFMNQCENLQAVGVTQNGAFAEYVVVPEEVVFPIGDLPYEIAAMIEPLACVVWGLKRINVQPGDSVLIIGAGPMGCLVTQAIRAAGAADVTILDKVPWRLDIAHKLGASNTIETSSIEKGHPQINPVGYQIVVEATGVSKALEAAFNLIRPRGKIWVFGVIPPNEKVSFAPYDVFRNDLSIIGSFAVNQTFHEAIMMIQSGSIKIKPLISHQIPMREFSRALEVAQSDTRRMKVQLVISPA